MINRIKVKYREIVNMKNQNNKFKNMKQKLEIIYQLILLKKKII